MAGDNRSDRRDFMELSILFPMLSHVEPSEYARFQ